jgi:hypothetical protein
MELCSVLICNEIGKALAEVKAADVLTDLLAGNILGFRQLTADLPLGEGRSAKRSRA